MTSKDTNVSGHAKPDRWYLSIMSPNTKGEKFAWLDPTSIYINGEAFHDLLDDLVAWLSHHVGANELSRGFKPLPIPSGVSPRRSLDGTVVEVARLLNNRCRAGTLSPEDRKSLLMALLDSSDRIRSQRQGLDSFRANHAAQMDALDDELNGDFWRQRAKQESPWNPK